MAYLGLPEPSVLVLARKEYSPVSDPGDPHAWSIEIRDFDEPKSLSCGLQLRWSCPRCLMVIDAQATVRFAVLKKDEDEVREKVVRKILEAGREEGARVHPRCSELKAVVEVMGS